MGSSTNHVPCPIEENRCSVDDHVRPLKPPRSIENFRFCIPCVRDVHQISSIPLVPLDACHYRLHNRYLIVHIACSHKLQQISARYIIQQILRSTHLAIIINNNRPPLILPNPIPTSPLPSPQPGCQLCEHRPLRHNTSASYSSSRKPRAPLPKFHLYGPHPHKRTLTTYRDERVPHPPLSLGIVLARDLIALVHAFAACETFAGCSVGRGRLGTTSAAGDGRVA